MPRGDRLRHPARRDANEKERPVTPKKRDLDLQPGESEFKNVVVRELREDDIDAIVKIDAQYSERTRREYYQRKLAEATRDSGLRISLAAEVDGIFAGFLIGRLYFGEFGIPEPVAIVDSIGVHGDFRGRHVGAALLEQLETNLRGVGIETIETQVDWDRFGLLGFLAGHGFSPAPILTLTKKLR